MNNQSTISADYTVEFGDFQCTDVTLTPNTERGMTEFRERYGVTVHSVQIRKSSWQSTFEYFQAKGLRVS